LRCAAPCVDEWRSVADDGGGRVFHRRACASLAASFAAGVAMWDAGGDRRDAGALHTGALMPPSVAPRPRVAARSPMSGALGAAMEAGVQRSSSRFARLELEPITRPSHRRAHRHLPLRGARALRRPIRRASLPATVEARRRRTKRSSIPPGSADSPTHSIRFAR
jgi:hypothetical protein